MPRKKAPNDTRDEVMLATRVPEQLRARARKYGIDQRKSLQQVVIEALEEYLKKRGA